jgi:transcriptional regulator with XRE-family HTH domain
MSDAGEGPEIAHDGWGGARAPEWALDWGRLLRTARQVAGLSLTELSVRTQLSKGYLSKLESGAAGAANPSRATLAALARALPSFGPVAHMFGPEGAREELDFGSRTRRLQPALRVVAAPSAEPGVPIALGWRALEVLTALVALDAAALPLPVTCVVIARAVGREARDVRPVLDELVQMGLALRVAPARPGGLAWYRCADDAAARLGVSKLGDLLVLAAALLAGTQADRGTGMRRDGPAGDGDAESDDE